VGDDQLVNAVALNSATMNLSRVLGPTMAGLIIAVVAAGDTGSQFGVGVVFVANGLLYLISVLTVVVLDHKGKSQLLERGTIRGDMSDGLQYIWRHQLLRGLIIMTFIPLLFGFPVQSLMPVFDAKYPPSPGTSVRPRQPFQLRWSWRPPRPMATRRTT